MVKAYVVHSYVSFNGSNQHMQENPNSRHREPLPPATGTGIKSANPVPNFHAANQSSANPATNGFAIASLILGILGFILLPFIGPILAIIFGAVALSQIRKSNQPGSVLAKLGLGLGICSLALTAIAVTVFGISLVRDFTGRHTTPSVQSNLTSPNAGTSTDSADAGSSSTNSEANEIDRDSQRQTDLTNIQKGLEEYFVDNNQYPDSLSELTVGSAPIMDSIPTDPINKSPYVYSYVPLAGGYTLDACLEDPQDTNQLDNNDIVSPVSPCTTETYQLDNQN